jgi:hypothetical protein
MKASMALDRYWEKFNDPVFDMEIPIHIVIEEHVEIGSMDIKKGGRGSTPWSDGGETVWVMTTTRDGCGWRWQTRFQCVCVIYFFTCVGFIFLISTFEFSHATCLTSVSQTGKLNMLATRAYSDT